MNRNIIALFLFSISFTCFGDTMEELQKPRTWTARSGKTIDARFINLEKRLVTLENQNQEQIKIKLDDLAWEDQNLLVGYWLDTGQDRSALQAPPPPPSQPRQKIIWRYSNTKDEMTDASMQQASVFSSHPVHFDFPYDGGSYLEFILRKHPRFGKKNLIRISNGQFNATSVLIRLGNAAPKTYSCTQSSDGSADVLFLPYDASFISELKRSST